ncbi:hypothetical protein INR77_12590 [Erythrobacter sp. SCSIO 43205]|nr:hypothetical protein INR77_12590 [Erythrobacter sp. SCSIO 43205]
MPATFQEALPLILLGLALLVVLFVIVRSSRKTKIIDKVEGDVLDEGASPAARNQALIDAPRSVENTLGESSAAANADTLAAATASADAEAGPPIAPTKAAPDELKETASSAGEADDLKRIKGVGPKLVSLLNEQGITTFAQIAAWSDEDVKRIDATLGRFSGRIERDQWVKQAKLLSAGDEDGFAKTFGNNG